VQSIEKHRKFKVLKKHTTTFKPVTMMVRLLVLLLSSWTASATIGTPHEAVVDLQEGTFDAALVDPANSLWLLKFYAPWCGHCKKMAPILDAVAPKLKGKMAIGKIDCTTSKSLCTKYGVRGYPTMKFALDGDMYDYPGNRDETSIMAFAEKMMLPSVTLVSSYEEALEFAKNTQEGVAFVGYDTDAKGSSVEEILKSTMAGQVFSQVARKKKAFAYFCWLRPGADGLEKLKGVYRFVNRIETGDVEPRLWETHDPTTEGLMEFVQEQMIPLVSMFGPHNFQKIGKNGRPLVIGVVDESNEDQVAAVKDHMKSFITKSDKELVEKYYYGVMDGVKWSKFLEQFNVLPKDNPQVFILDVPTKRFWQNATMPNVFDFMKAVEDGTITSDVTAGKKGVQGFMGKLERVFLNYFPYSLGLILFFVLGVVYLLVPAEDESLRPPYNRERKLADKEYELDENDNDGDDKPAAPTEKKKDK
jgi:protein disulfide-isomerase-like protein